MELNALLIFGILAGCMVGVGLLLAFLRDFRFGFVITGVVFFISTLGVLEIQEFRISRTWLAPLQDHRTALMGALCGLVLCGLVAHAGRVSLRRIPGPGLMMLAVALYAGLLRMVHSSVEDGLASIGLALLTVTPLIVLFPSLLDTWTDFEKLFKTIAITMVVWSGAVFIQVFINREMLFASAGFRSGFRFAGLTANPQAASILLSVVAATAFWLVLNTQRGLWRMTFIGLTGASVIMLLWTGSRTGMGMMVLAVAAVLYARVGRAILAVPVLMVVGYGLYVVATAVLDIDLGLNRLASTEDTRSWVWAKMWETAMDNPAIGVGVEDAEVSENSLLFGFASYGFGMALLLVTVMLVSFAQVLKLLRIRWGLAAEQRRIVDVILGFYAAYFFGTIFEGYMIARISAINVLFFMFAAMATRAIQLAQEHEAVEEYGDEGAEVTYAAYAYGAPAEPDSREYE